MTEFKKWPSTPRLRRDVLITEKLDGTNAAVLIEVHPFGQSLEVHDGPEPHPIVTVLGPNNNDFDNGGDGLPDVEYHIYAQSRNRFVTLESDNYGFAAWVDENAEELVDLLGPGRHYGEWWGKGIQRGYGADRKYFSLFNVSWWDKRLAELSGATPETPFRVRAEQIGLRAVPTLAWGTMSDDLIEQALASLSRNGSRAVDNFAKPEGICVFHTQSRQVYKVLLENDHISKTEAGVK